MLQINFFPDSDRKDFSEGILEYQKIWNEDGKKIFDVLEKRTELKFRETTINAIVFDMRSQSYPLSLAHHIPTDRKKGVLAHELGHRILYGKMKKGSSNLESHKFLYLILGDVFVDLHGKEFLAETIKYEEEFLPTEYKQAWDWALAFNDSERKERFQKVLAGDLSALN